MVLFGRKIGTCLLYCQIWFQWLGAVKGRQQMFQHCGLSCQAEKGDHDSWKKEFSYKRDDGDRDSAKLVTNFRVYSSSDYWKARCVVAPNVRDNNDSLKYSILICRGKDLCSTGNFLPF